MPNNTLDRAIEAVPKFEERISLFTKKLRLAQYADSSIYNYRLKIAQAVLYLKKLPDDFTQADVDGYLSMLLDRNRYTISHFKHTVFGLKNYYECMGLKEPGGLVLPKVRKPKRLPRVLSQEQVKRLISLCDLYDKTLLSTIYDCMFKAAWATIDAFATKKGLTSGMTAILHTWGSNLFYHPHIHCIVPGGGVDMRGVWHHIKGCKRSDFLFPVVAMSTKFRGRFMSLLTRRLKEKGVIIDQSIRKHCFTKHCLAHWALTEAVCETHVFVDRFIVPLCAVNSVFCIIFD